MREAYSVQTIETCVPVAEYLRACVDVEKFLGFCRECGNYGRRWSCPPFEFDPLELWNRYDTLHLYARVLVPAPGADTDGLLGGMKAEKEGLLGQLLALELVRGALHPSGRRALPLPGKNALFHRGAGRQRGRNGGALPA